MGSCHLPSQAVWRAPGRCARRRLARSVRRSNSGVVATTETVLRFVALTAADAAIDSRGPLMSVRLPAPAAYRQRMGDAIHALASMDSQGRSSFEISTPTWSPHPEWDDDAEMLRPRNIREGRQ